MEALGRLFNVLASADDTYINMRNASAVTFVANQATPETLTLTEARDASGTGAQVLATIDRYHSAATNGATWTLRTQSVASTIVTQADDIVALHVAGVELSDNYTHLKLAGSGSGVIVAITHDLLPQRDPARLPAIGA